MKTTNKAKAIMKLLKQGYSPREVTQRMAVSYNYAWKLKKDLEGMIGTPKPEPEPEVKAKAGEYIVVEGDKNAQEVDAILNERATNYGSFADVARMAQRLKSVAHTSAGEQGRTFAHDQAEALDMIFSKIARILNGNANHTDSWIDIAGYATLVADRLQGKTR
jgi:transposase